MNKRDKAFLEWVRDHRPDVLEEVRKFINGTEDSSPIYALISMSFEAGRVFQQKNEYLEPNDPSQYLFRDFHPCPKCRVRVGCEDVDMGGRHWGSCLNCGTVLLESGFARGI